MPQSPRLLSQLPSSFRSRAAVHWRLGRGRRVLDRLWRLWLGPLKRGNVTAEPSGCRAGGYVSTAGHDPCAVDAGLSWAETAAILAELPTRGTGRAETASRARELLASFLISSLGASEVRFLPLSMVVQGPERMAWPLAETGEAVEVCGVAVSDASRRKLAAVAARTTGAVLLTLQVLRHARAQTLTDALTGLYNRRALDKLLPREVLLAHRHGTPLAVAMLDLDHFKLVNDRLGHAAGDEVLQRVATTLVGTLRRSDLAFRLGGDEFCVALPQTSAASAAAAMEKVRSAWCQLDLSATRGVTLSVGITEYRSGQSATDLLAAADAALYDAKRHRRDCVRIRRAA